MVVAVAAVRGLSEVGAPLATLGVGLACGEVLRDAHEHQLLGVVQSEGHGVVVGALGAAARASTLGGCVCVCVCVCMCVCDEKRCV